MQSNHQPKVCPSCERGFTPSISQIYCSTKCRGYGHRLKLDIIARDKERNIMLVYLGTTNDPRKNQMREWILRRVGT